MKKILLTILVLAILVVGGYFVIKNLDVDVPIVDKEPLMVKDIEDMKMVGIQDATQYQKDALIYLVGEGCDESNSRCNYLFPNTEQKGATYYPANVFSDQYQEELLPLMFTIYIYDEDINIENNAYIELTYDGGKKINVELPNIKLEAGQHYFYDVNSDGSISKSSYSI